MHISGLFPGNSNNAFVFDSGSYKQTDSLIRGRGCWLNFDSSKSYTVTGRKTDTNIVPVSQGWNIIGTFDYTVYTSEITSDPANILESNFFGFSNGYFPAWTLSSGGGYWVYVSQAGNLTLPNLGVKKPVAGTEPVNSFGDFANIEFKDESGNKSNLYFCVGNVNTEFYKLPPVPPSSSFDARFENNSYVRNLNLKQHSVNIQSTLGNYSLKIINAGNIKFKIRDAVNGKMVNKTLINGQEILIDGRIDKLIIENDFAVPLTYELMQNYPNPFNSMTKINYQIPSQGFVTIKIYDVTGRLIKTLLNDIRDAGEYSVLFDAGGLSSGVYFYSFVSGNFTSVKKMMYIK
ncbi:MAG: T9SS type A sorting domain-containing protein [Ignavibacteriae bacterium]|nr:T9SS type A sorting domain-containing protein [Ignavibacteriota bacterium]